MYQNNTKIDRQIALNPNLREGGGINPGISAWFDRDKEQLLKDTQQRGRRYCQERKLRDLSSNPITHLNQTGPKLPQKASEMWLPRR